MREMPISKLKEWMDFAMACGQSGFWDDGEDVEEAPGPAENGAGPPVDLFRAGGEVIVVAELPGVRREELEVTAAGRSLTIRGLRRAAPFADTLGELISAERRTGPFERTIALPPDAEPAGTPSASMRDGLLIVRIPASAT